LTLLCLSTPARYDIPVPRRILALSTCVLASGLACSYYDASLLDPRAGTNDSGTDAGLDVSHEAAADVVEDTTQDTVDVVNPPDVAEAQTCGHARPPDPPAISDAGGDIEFIVAVSSVDFGDASGDPGAYGYDLDFRCTCQGEGNGCLRENWASADACDGPEGRDNITGAFMAKMAALFDNFGSEDWSAAALAGEWSLLLRVRGYNGEPNDDRVRLDWYVPDQYWEDKPDKTYVPAWDGTDTWPLRASTLEDDTDIETPKYFDEHAYVSDGVLVGSLTESAFQLSAEYAVEFNGAFITANIVQVDNRWGLEEGLLASRWKIDTILAQISRISLLGLPLCTNHPAYAGIKAQICAYADIYSGVGGPTTPCDSISTGMRFETAPATFGEIVVDAAQPSPCEPALDPGNDSCDTL
jgi:hypothetical protein